MFGFMKNARIGKLTAAASKALDEVKSDYDAADFVPYLTPDLESLFAMARLASAEELKEVSARFAQLAHGMLVNGLPEPAVLMKLFGHYCDLLREQAMLTAAESAKHDIAYVLSRYDSFFNQLSELKASAPAVAPAPPRSKPATQSAPVAETRDYPFQVGDEVLYPEHGKGRVIAIERQEISGTLHDLYVVDFTPLKLRLKLPVSKAESKGMTHA